MTLRALRIAALRCAPLLLLLLSACEKDGTTPSFVRILSPTAAALDGSGTIPSAVTDFWVYANDEAIGVWQENRRIPVLKEGTTTIKIIAGVRRNGVTNDRIQYPFYATWSQTVDLRLGQETILQPVFTHFNAPIWDEGFEGPGFEFNFDESEVDMTFATGAEDVLVGSSSGVIALDTGNTTFQGITIGPPYFPNGTEATFLELDHKSDTRFLIGVRYISGGGQTTNFPYAYVSPSGSAGSVQPWKHIYIDLSSAWGLGGGSSRQFYIQAQLENGATSGRIVLDNLNVYH